MMVCKKIKCPIYDNTIYLIESNDLKKVEKRFKLGISPNAHAVTVEIEGGAVFIVFNTGHSSPHNHGVITHECLHATNFILDFNGIKADFYNDEAQAYLLKYIVNLVYKHLKGLVTNG